MQKFAAALAPAALALVMAGATPASAAVQPTVDFAGGLVVQGDTAYLNIRYTCTTGTEGAGNHLYVALKQGAQIDTGEHSSSRYASSYYSTNWSVDEGPNALNCDGKQHLQRLVLQQDPYWQGAANAVPFSAGPALVQLCLFDNITGVDPTTGEPTGGADFDYSMQRVQVTGASR